VFSLRVRVNFGDVVKVVGSHTALGNWDVSQAVAMTWSAGDVWKASAELPEHFVVRYKARRGASASQTRAACRVASPRCALAARSAPRVSRSREHLPNPAAAPHARSSSSTARTARCSGSRARTAPHWPAAPPRASPHRRRSTCSA
jgi:hypothetical protein